MGAIDSEPGNYEMERREGMKGVETSGKVMNAQFQVVEVNGINKVLSVYLLSLCIINAPHYVNNHVI